MKQGGDILDVVDEANLETIATDIGSKWASWTSARQSAMTLNQEVRQYLNAVDIDSTTADIQDHKNRTHIPKLSEIADGLKSLYWEAAFGIANFFVYQTDLTGNKEPAKDIQAWVNNKLESKKIRDTVGRKLVDDYVERGNVFLSVSYIREVDELGEVIFKGCVWKRRHPNSIVFDPTAESFRESPKITRNIMHMAKLQELPEKFPSYGFDAAKINEVIERRHPNVLTDWADRLQSHNLRFDGYNNIEDYLTSGYVEVLVYKGDIFNPDTGEVSKNRLIYVTDRAEVILDVANPSPLGFDGEHHVGWRTRSDNLWAMGPLDNLIGMQWRTDSLENKKADVFDLISNPVLKIKGEQVIEPEDGYAPGAAYYLGDDGDVTFLVPDTTVLAADTQIARYHQLMEEFAGLPRQSQGFRTPGEKTAFEVDTLDSNANRKFMDKTKLFEGMIEEALKESYMLMLKNFDGEDYVKTFDDIEGAVAIKTLTLQDIKEVGNFVAIGSEHFEQTRKSTVQMQQFQLGPMQDPKIRAHVSGINLANFYETNMGIEKENIVEEFAGVKEDVAIEAFAQAEAQRVQQQLEQEGQPIAAEAAQQGPGAVEEGVPT